jgi:iron complex outermembrane receptor protein
MHKRDRTYIDGRRALRRQQLLAKYSLAAAVAFSVSSVATAADDNQLAEIVVTAQKRVENIKDIPVSISQLSGDELSARHIVDYDDLSRSVPSVSFAAGGTEGTSNIEMRGVSSAAGAAVVAVYLDESSITTPGSGWIGQAQPIPFDFARVEVLRGPQGTLYGASSMGGAIRFISNQPKLDSYEVDVVSEVSGTDYGGVNYNESVVANAPINSELALRVGVNYGSNSGWIDHYNYLSNQKDGTGINSVEQAVVKVGLLYRPTDDLTITPTLWLQRVESADSSVFYPDLGLFRTNKEESEPSNDRIAIPALKIEQHLDRADLTSVSTYFWRDNNRQIDGTYFNDAALAYFYLDPNPVFASHQPENDSIIAHIASPVNAETKGTQFTQELRATSIKPREGELPLQWTAGLYYSHVTQNSQNSEYAPGLNAAFNSIYGFPLSSPIVQNALGTTATTFANDIMFVSPSRSRIAEYAAFGQFQYDLLPRLHASAGVRYEYSTQSYSVTDAGFYGIGLPSSFSANSKTSATTPRFSAVYDLTDTSTAYATIAKGYRIGGGTGPIPESVCGGDLKAIGLNSAPNTYASDSLWSYELGTKLLLDDRALSIDLSTYLINWKNIQQSIALPDCGFAFTDNFGDARSYGAEVQVAYKPSFVRNLTLGLNAGGGKSVITRSDDPSAAAVGQHTLFVPEYTATATAEYKATIFNGILGVLRADYDWTGLSYGSFQATDPDYRNPAYGVFNGSIGIEAGSLQVSIFGKNLTNNQTIIQRPNIASVVEGYSVRPITIGLSVSKQFR